MCENIDIENQHKLLLAVVAVKQRCFGLGMMPSSEMVHNFCEKLIDESGHFDGIDKKVALDYVSKMETLCNDYVNEIFEKAQKEFNENDEMGEEEIKEYTGMSIKFC